MGLTEWEQSWSMWKTAKYTSGFDGLWARLLRCFAFTTYLLASEDLHPTTKISLRWQLQNVVSWTRLYERVL